MEVTSRSESRTIYSGRPTETRLYRFTRTRPTVPFLTSRSWDSQVPSRPSLPEVRVFSIRLLGHWGETDTLPPVPALDLWSDRRKFRSTRYATSTET